MRGAGRGVSRRKPHSLFQLGQGQQGIDVMGLR